MPVTCPLSLAVARGLAGNVSLRRPWLVAFLVRSGVSAVPERPKRGQPTCSRRSATNCRGVPRPARPGCALPRRRRRGPARDPAGAARGGRPLQGGQAVPGARPRAGHRARSPEEPDPRPGRACASCATRWSRCSAATSRPGCRPRRGCPSVVLMAGLQGSGKTTTTAKLGRWLAKGGHHPLLVSTDVYRPAAREQLRTLGEQTNLKVHHPAEPRRSRAPSWSRRSRRPARSATTSCWSTPPAGCTSTTS